MALGLTLEGSKILRDGNAADGLKSCHLVKFAAGKVAADGAEDCHGELIRRSGGEDHQGPLVAGLGGIVLRGKALARGVHSQLCDTDIRAVNARSRQGELAQRTAATQIRAVEKGLVLYPCVIQNLSNDSRV